MTDYAVAAAMAMNEWACLSPQNLASNGNELFWSCWVNLADYNAEYELFIFISLLSWKLIHFINNNTYIKQMKK